MHKKKKREFPLSMLLALGELVVIPSISACLVGSFYGDNEAAWLLF
jgi:hypothetical protein